MYNLTVEGAHTFFVGEGQWLVHNSNACDDLLNRALQSGQLEGTRITTAKGTYEIGIAASAEGKTLVLSDAMVFKAQGTTEGLGFSGSRQLWRDAFEYAEKNGFDRVVIDYGRIASGSASNPGARLEVWQLVNGKWIAAK